MLQDTDLVPSDIAAGLALLHQEQDKMERSRDPEVLVSHSTSSPIVSDWCAAEIRAGGAAQLWLLFCFIKENDLQAELEKAAHYMQFAAAAYGWPLYVYANLCTGACRLSRDWWEAVLVYRHAMLRFVMWLQLDLNPAMYPHVFSCRTRAPEHDIVDGDHLGCHFSSILQTTGLQYRDFIYVCFHNQVWSLYCLFIGGLFLEAYVNHVNLIKLI